MKKERKTVIMLDVDGVLNSEQHYKRIHETCDDRQSLSYAEENLCRDSVDILNTIVEKTDCDVILSSTWREGIWCEPCDKALKYTEKCLIEMGFKYTLKDKTGKCCSGIRGVEVRNYMRKHPEYDEYAILDDDNDFLIEQIPNFFRTNRYYGLDIYTAHEIIDFLNGVKTKRVGDL